jgi:DNA mismatch repair protein MutL
MEDVIRLLPDTVANQIAAGEVVQRPASVVKELMENAVDARAGRVHVVIKDAGKTLIQVGDDGTGMSQSDARLCFERHATSKITLAEDLFKINTKGFRGEALASIASIARVELKTRRREDDLGTSILIEGNALLECETAALPQGSTFMVRNLFYNVPARRNFLKSNQVEFGHVTDEFIRVAMAHPELAFSLNHNQQDIFRLEKSSLRQRIVSIMGQAFNERLVPVKESTEIMNVEGFAVKPEFARKTRGEQFLFINKRYIKNNYLHHSIMKAFEGLLASEHHPGYFLFIDLPPSFIDVNIHPTKTEIKFEDDRTVYAMVRSAVRRALGVYNISPALDFDVEMTANIEPLPPGVFPKQPEIRVNPHFNPFEREKRNSGQTDFRKHFNEKDWQPSLPLSGFVRPLINPAAQENQPPLPLEQEENNPQHEEIFVPVSRGRCVQIGGLYIAASIKTGMMLMHQVYAHQRILFEGFMKRLHQQGQSGQRLAIPLLTEVAARDWDLLKEQETLLGTLGLEFASMGGQTVAIHSVPSGIEQSEMPAMLDELIGELRTQGRDAADSLRERIARGMSLNFCYRQGRLLDEHEMQALVDQLFACEDPWHSPKGKPTIATYTLEEISANFK